MARLDAWAKLSGQARYTADYMLPGWCHAALVVSPFSHARIIAVATEEAQAVPGVIGVFTAADVSPERYGRRVRDVPVLARERVRFAGERVAAVVATTRAAAEQAAARVRVEYDPLPAVVDAREALDPQAPAVHEAPWAFPGAVVKEGPDSRNLQSQVVQRAGGDVEAALAGSAWVVDRWYTTPSGHQGYLEPQAAMARVGSDGAIEVWAANKSPYRLREQLATWLGVDPERVTVHPVLVGGDFGGKGSPMDVPLAVELARLVGRPVRIVRRYAEDLMGTNPRHAAYVHVRAGCDGQGRLTALWVDAVFNGGAYAGYKPLPSVNLHGAEEPGTWYRIPAIFVRSRVAYTHTVPGGHMRAPGAPQVNFAVESAIDELAEQAGQDPVAFRRQNLLRSGEANPFGIVWAEARAEQTLEAALAAYRPLPAPPGWRHGRGIAVYDRPTRIGRTSLRVLPAAGGGVVVEVPFPETGTGSHTAVRKGMAQALGLDPAQVEVRQGSTAELPTDDGVGGSRVTAAISAAVGKAAQAYRDGGGQPVTVEVDAAPERRVTSFCVQIAQVAVDPASGAVRVLEILSAVDVANVINPIAHRLQLEGAAAMGYGFACLEDLEMVEGKVTAANLGEFKIPSSRDVPQWRTVLVPGGVGLGLLNVKGAGELTNVPTAAAIANAVYQAVGVRPYRLPIRAEAVWAELPAAKGEQDLAGAG